MSAMSDWLPPLQYLTMEISRGRKRIEREKTALAPGSKLFQYKVRRRGVDPTYRNFELIFSANFFLSLSN